MTKKQKEKIYLLKKELEKANVFVKYNSKTIKWTIPKIKKRDFNKCRICNEKNDLQIHHLKPKNLGGNDHPNNLMTLCKSCHLFMHCNPKLIMREKLQHRKRTKKGLMKSKKSHLIGKRGKDKKPRKSRIFNVEVPLT